MCNSVSFKMSGGVFRNIKKKKKRKKSGKKHYSPSVWSYSPMNRLVKKRTVRAVKKKKKKKMRVSIFLYVFQLE